MNNYPNVGAGLKKMFIAQIGIIVCTVLAIIPIINIIAGIGAIVFAVISIVGLYGAGKDIEGCKKAFIITIVNIVIKRETIIDMLEVADTIEKVTAITMLLSIILDINSMKDL